MMKLTRNFIIACVFVYVLSTFEQAIVEPGPRACFLRLRVREKGFLRRAANAAGRFLFGIDTREREPPLNTERIPVGMFPDPKELAQELDMLENRKIVPDNNRQAGVQYIADIANGQTPNMESLSNGQMAQISSGAFDRGSEEALGAANKTRIAEIRANREREQALQSQGQMVKDGEQIKIGKPGPVTLNDPDEDKKGKTIPPNLAAVDEEDNFMTKEANPSLFSNPFVILSIFAIIVCMFAAGGLIFFKKKGKKKKRKSSS
ncbi:putative signal peptide protein and transmembrane domain near C-terminus [Cryptosporidium canis]|uniref:Signal peptide protein and transmembrane domain near C-terminus n=1 Tax=Cryptosporidium canis TaxID=195482 RepID=A0ABQ8P9L0_9CRYT|nr:putative signal peptide protein and transmembrane domain near C-terminus [Cryptosporidium canis]KAJ1613686.1 putative signal peptide protein and transmembrane domain near C-terminus [Cryptosporidium canis]